MANEAMLMCIPGVVFSADQQASVVAPEVITSSTSNMCLFSNFELFRTPKTSAILSILFSCDLWVCVLV